MQWSRVSLMVEPHGVITGEIVANPAVGDDLSAIVDRARSGKDHSRILRDEPVQVAHPTVRIPDKGARAQDISGYSNNDARIVERVRLAVVATRQNAKVLHAILFLP